MVRDRGGHASVATGRHRIEVHKRVCCPLVRQQTPVRATSLFGERVVVDWHQDNIRSQSHVLKRRSKVFTVCRGTAHRRQAVSLHAAQDVWQTWAPTFVHTNHACTRVQKRYATLMLEAVHEVSSRHGTRTYEQGTTSVAGCLQSFSISKPR